MAELDAVHVLLPVWARCPGLLLGPFALAIGFAVTSLAARVALPRMRRLASAHWTERARAAQPARWIAAMMSFSAAASLASLTAQRAGVLLPVPSWVLTLGVGVAAYLGSSWAVARLEAQLGMRVRSRIGFIFGRLGLLLVVFPQLVVIAVLSCVVDGEPGPKNLVAAALGVSSYALLAIWGGLPLARAFGAVHPPSPKLRDAVDRAVAKTGIVAEFVCELDLPITNAFALPLPRWLVFTRRCVEALNEHELEGVACHELGHLSEPTPVKAARTGASFALLPLGFAPAFIDAFGWLVGLGGVYAVVLGVSIPMQRLSRRMEARADAVAGRHDEDAATYAIALERLHEANLAPAVGWSRGGTHPHLYDRMEAAGVVPVYPRPQSPSRARAVVGSLVGIAALTFLCLLLADLGVGVAAAPERRAAVDVALFGGSSDDFFQLAAYDARREPEEAMTFLRAALVLQPAHHAAQALLAEKLVAVGRCGEALAAQDGALRILAEQHWDHAGECPWVVRAAAAIAACK